MPDGDREDVADRLSERFDDAGEEKAEEPDPDRNDEDAPNAPGVTDAPYGTSSTYSTPGGFEMTDIDEANVRDGADREFYMPPELLEELDLTFDRLNLRYQTEVGRRLNKHPHWYNRLLVLGLAVVGDVDERDMDELQELLNLPEPAED